MGSDSQQKVNRYGLYQFTRRQPKMKKLNILPLVIWGQNWKMLSNNVSNLNKIQITENLTTLSLCHSTLMGIVKFKCIHEHSMNILDQDFKVCWPFHIKFIESGDK